MADQHLHPVRTFFTREIQIPDRNKTKLTDDIPDQNGNIIYLGKISKGV